MFVQTTKLFPFEYCKKIPFVVLMELLFKKTKQNKTWKMTDLCIGIACQKDFN